MDQSPTLPPRPPRRAARPTPSSPTASSSWPRRSRREVGRVIVGQADLVRQTLICLLAGGHALLEGVPGLGKTLLVRTIADVVACSFNRIQFTPDLMPADIIGTNILVEEGGSRVFRFQQGPSSPTSCSPTRSTGRRPRRSRRCSRRCRSTRSRWPGRAIELDEPFFVLATQNPLEMEGTYPAARGTARPLHVQGPRPVPERGRTWRSSWSGRPARTGPEPRWQPALRTSSRCSSWRAPCRSRRT